MRFLHKRTLIFILFLTFNLYYTGYSAEILLIKDDNSITSQLLHNDILNLGYSVTVVIPDLITPQLINSHSLVLLSSGNNTIASINDYMRDLIITYSEDGGKLIVEGGNLSYSAAVFPGYPGFMNKVLRVRNWISNQGGSLRIIQTHSNKLLAVVPNTLPQNISLTYSGAADQDVCQENQYSEIFYGTADYNNYGGIIVAPNVDNPQIINLCFNYSALTSKSDAKNLLANCIYNLIGGPVSVHSVGDYFPDRFRLYQNYPNPFNPDTKIRFDVAGRDGSSKVMLYVYDAAGREIERLVDEVLTAGTYEVNFKARNLVSGVYYYTFVTANHTETKKLILIK